MLLILIFIDALGMHMHQKYDRKGVSFCVINIYAAYSDL